ncbi:MAG TPA: hypothetical protein VNN79_03770 [Actinomycetota bacterium]|nr:hypothetical protein [Actinomycetota bacterium]
MGRTPSSRRPPGPLEPRWPASLAVVAGLIVYFQLPESVSLGPRWLIPALEAVLVIPLTIAAPFRHRAEDRVARMVSLVLLGVVNGAVLVSLGLLVHEVLTGGNLTGESLVGAGVAIWIAMVIGFGLTYWEMDRGGPAIRGREDEGSPDFMFPQMSTHELGQQDWQPRFLDYAYLSFTNSTAFSPTDTLPLTQRAKALMMIEAGGAITIALMVVGRAVNVLG